MPWPHNPLADRANSPQIVYSRKFATDPKEVLRDQCAGTQGKGRYVFSNAWGGPLDLTNIRHRIWYPTLARAGLRPRNLYQTRHTFASLMLQAGEDPAWIARMMGQATTKMLCERDAAFIRYWTPRTAPRTLNK